MPKGLDCGTGRCTGVKEGEQGGGEGMALRAVAPLQLP